MKVGILGASGYVGGELLRLLLNHDKVEITCVTSSKYAGEYIHIVHPNLRGKTKLKFVKPNIAKVLSKIDFLFISTPHGVSSTIVPEIIKSGIRIVDTSADFRLKNPEEYVKWYGWKHKCPELLKESVYGLPELHRNEISSAKLVAGPGCMAISAIIALAPIIASEKINLKTIIADFKVGSSGGGASPSLSSHHPEHFGVVRPYKPVGHRHTGEINQELSFLAGKKVSVSMSAHAVNMVRGILSTCHTFLLSNITLKDLWKIYRNFYENEPFIRLVRTQRGIFRYPDPKIVIGSNFCDVGFELDQDNNRVVLFSALDNLIKGAAGTAVQSMNIMCNWEEQQGLKQSGLHPV